MRATLLLAALICVPLLACEGGAFVTCKQKLLDADALKNNQLLMPVDTHLRLRYCEADTSGSLKHDPLLGLCLFKDDRGFAYPFKKTAAITKQTAAVSASGIAPGHLTSRQCGLKHLAAFSNAAAKAPGIVVEPCCSYLGMLTPRGVIEVKYIEHFLKDDFSGYGDAGAVFKEEESSIVVAYVNPYVQEQKLRSGDRILAYDEVSYSSLCALEEAILFSKPHSLHRFSIERDGKRLHVKVKLLKKRFGGLVRENYLLYSGIMLNEALCIESVSDKAKQMKLKVNDCLLQVNGTKVHDHESIARSLRSDQENLLLFEREHFQFFIHLQTKTY